MAVSHAAGRGGLVGIGARIVPWRQLAIGIVNVSDRLTAPPARARPLIDWFSSPFAASALFLSRNQGQGTLGHYSTCVNEDVSGRGPNPAPVHHTHSRAGRSNIHEFMCMGVRASGVPAPRARPRCTHAACSGLEPLRAHPRRLFGPTPPVPGESRRPRRVPSARLVLAYPASPVGPSCAAAPVTAISRWRPSTLPESRGPCSTSRALARLPPRPARTRATEPFPHKPAAAAAAGCAASRTRRTGARLQRYIKAGLVLCRGDRSPSPPVCASLGQPQGPATGTGPVGPRDN
jgi:hypothetical protein